MITHNLGYPRIGTSRELKKASEAFWNEKIQTDELKYAGKMIRLENWQTQKDAGIDIIPSNDFSFYDQVLDMSLMLGAIPVRFRCLQNFLKNDDFEFYFALARGYQKEGYDIRPMEMTKWFDTNYHYIVPEFRKNQNFELLGRKAVNEFIEARDAGFMTKPVLIGPLSFVLLGKCEEDEFDRLDLLPDILPVYLDLLYRITEEGAEWVQFDEPFIVTNLSEKAREFYRIVYNEIRTEFPGLKILLATYFDSIGDNMDLVVNLPVDAVHLDLVRAPEQLESFLQKDTSRQIISLGIVDGRNIWKNDFAHSLRLIHEALENVGEERIMIAPSCSLIHSPIDLDLETDENTLPAQTRDWLAFARQKLDEVVSLKELALQRINVVSDNLKLHLNQESIAHRKTSSLIHNEDARNRLSIIAEIEKSKRADFSSRKIRQQQKLHLPLFPTTTIGSFPQTAEVRNWRSKLKKGEMSAEEYNRLISEEIRKAVKWQEEAGFDVLVHGEFERNDMVEYFGEMLEGFAFTRNGWIQSYGSRYVKPPVIYGDVWRSKPMTIEWITYAQSLTDKPVKGMLTGPVTILQWSFVRDDQPRSETCFQIALAIRDEVLDLEREGIKVIQIDEPALREGLPLRKENRNSYLNMAVKAFRLTYAGVLDETQIHTHMCYSEFSDIMNHIAALDADVLTIECSRSNMELLDVFGRFSYPNDIGPGLYDIHSPRIPSLQELESLINKAASVIPESQLWINPDCGLKTRTWDEVKRSLTNMMAAVRIVKEKKAVPAR